MANITGSLGGVAGGVSQQPDILRHPGQCTEQVNMWIDPVNGLRRRPSLENINPTMFEAFLGTDAHYHWFSLNGTDFVAVFGSVGLYVFDTLGNSYTVNQGAYDTYITPTFSSGNLTSVQVGEYNLIANSAVKCAMDPAIPVDYHVVTIFVKEGMEWGLKYVVRQGATSYATYTAPAGDVVNDTTIAQIGSLYVAEQLYDQLYAGLSSTWDSVILSGNTIILRRSVNNPVHNPADAPSFNVDDGRGGANISVTFREVQTLAQLPPRSYPGHWVHVSGRSASTVDDFYMKYEAGSAQGEGRWVETQNPLEPVSFDPTTMPHALIRAANDEFYFTPLDGSTLGGSIVDTWAGREAGDKDSNPEPAFIGKVITGMTMIQNRLSLLTDDHVNMSRTRREFNMFSNSALADVDTDPIELSSPGTEIANLFSITEHEQYAVVMGDKRQFAIPLKAALTRQNAALIPTTAYAVDRCDPVTAGDGLYFAYSDDMYSGIREYRTGTVESVNHADAVTDHIDKYIPANLKSLVSDSQNTVIYALPPSGNEVYVYQYLTRGEEKLISAWHKLTLGRILPMNINVVRGVAYVVGRWSHGGISEPSLGLFKLNYAPEIHLDLRFNGVVTGGSVDVSDWPFHPSASLEDIRCILTSGPYTGLRVQVEGLSNGVLSLTEEALFDGYTVAVGIVYTSLYTPTMPVLRDSHGKAMQLDRLTVNDLLVSVQDTGPFRGIVAAPYYEDTVQQFTGREVGSTFIVGEYPASTRTEQVAVWHDARNVDVSLVCDYHRDMIIQSVEYKAAYTMRGGRY